VPYWRLSKSTAPDACLLAAHAPPHPQPVPPGSTPSTPDTQAVSPLPCCPAWKSNCKKYDLICMDIMMPEMDGQQALREIRALEEAAGTLSGDQARIIMTTALEDMKNLSESSQGWCDAYLTKPIDNTKLLGYLKSFALIA
jgi:CheY-like chemotaxis protein